MTIGLFISGLFICEVSKASRSPAMFRPILSAPSIGLRTVNLPTAKLPTFSSSRFIQTKWSVRVLALWALSMVLGNWANEVQAGNPWVSAIGEARVVQHRAEDIAPCGLRHGRTASRHYRVQPHLVQSSPTTVPTNGKPMGTASFRTLLRPMFERRSDSKRVCR